MALEMPRSGDAVLTSAERLVPLLAVISPWIDGLVGWLQAHLTYTQLGTGYAEVLQAAIIAYLPVLLGRWRMRQIRDEDRIAALDARLPADWPGDVPDGPPPVVGMPTDPIHPPPSSTRSGPSIRPMFGSAED